MISCSDCCGSEEFGTFSSKADAFLMADYRNVKSFYIFKKKILSQCRLVLEGHSMLLEKE